MKAWLFLLAICALFLRGVSSIEVNLPMGEINVIVLTDTHSFVGGRGKKEIYTADYGHVLSFYERLKHHCLQAEKDLWFVMNGDWIDGTGLALNGDPSFLVPLLEKMPWDAVNIGNHELYDNQVIEYATRPGGFVSWWGKRYLSSNVRYAASGQALGSKYVVLRGHKDVLCFGFLYDMPDAGSLISVADVETTVNEQWFTDAIKKERYDAVLVLAHMGCRDELVGTILRRIRKFDATVPVQFLTGHTHVRDYHQHDDYSASFEAGHFLDTIGFASFPSKATIANTTTNSSRSLFRHKFVDADVDVIAETLGLDDVLTPDGSALSQFIGKTRKVLGLEEVVSCLEYNLFLNRSLDGSESLWRFFQEQIVPWNFDPSHVVVFDRGVWRYDLYKGDIILDELLRVAAFNETLWLWEDVPGDILLQLNSTLNWNFTYGRSRPFMPVLPDYIFSSVDEIAAERTYKMVTDTFDRERIGDALSSIYSADVTRTLASMTQSQLWVNFFESNDFCGGDQSGRPRDRGHHAASGSSGSSISEDPELDLMRLLFVFVSSIFVFGLASVHIQQRGRIYQQHCAQEEFEIVEARRIFEEDDRFV